MVIKVETSVSAFKIRLTDGQTQRDGARLQASDPLSLLKAGTVSCLIPVTNLCRYKANILQGVYVRRGWRIKRRTGDGTLLFLRDLEQSLQLSSAERGTC